MRSRGVEGVIIRATHGDDVDQRLHQHVRDARAGGYTDSDLGFYTFINPKRASAAQCARATLDAIRSALGHLNTVYMLDVENYKGEPPNKGTAPTFGPAYATYLREQMDEVRRLAPETKVIAYGNESFWSGPIATGSRDRWVNDAMLASELEWIVPRYPVLPKAAIQAPIIAALNANSASRLRDALPALEKWQRDNPHPDPVDWATWAFNAQPAGPKSPSGVPWAGWQFAGDWNGQGPRYGMPAVGAGQLVPSLDLNIVRTDAWQRWTGTTPQIRGFIRGDILTAGSDTLLGDQGLAPGEQRVSKNGLTTFAHQSDGNVVVRRGNRQLFATDTAGRGSIALIMQTDGNLVLYDNAGVALWFSGTHGNPGAGLRVDNDGRAVIFTPSMRQLWASDTTPDDTVPVPDRPTAVVRPNDGWIKIAKRELGDGSRWREIARLNGGETRILHPGDIIILPN